MSKDPARSSGSLELAARVLLFLRANTFFGGLPDAALDRLIGRGHTRRFAKNEVMCRRGDPGDSLMVMLSGRAKVVNTTTDAKEVVLMSGDLNGEIAALDGKGRTADTIALEPCEVFAVHARDLLPTLVAHPEAFSRSFRFCVKNCARHLRSSRIIRWRCRAAPKGGCCASWNN